MFSMGGGIVRRVVSPCLSDSPTARPTTSVSVSAPTIIFHALVALDMLGRNETGRYFNMPDVELYLDRQKQTYIGGELEHYSA
jgi:hypothetical protein